MNTSTDASQLPNPMTPMAFFPPELAFQLTISVYVFVGSVAVLIWDVLNNLRGDLTVLFRYPLKIPLLVYLFSRIAILAFTLTAVVYSTAPVDISCFRLNKVVDSLFAVAVSSTSLLFLIRVLAIFHRNKLVRVFFCAMWLAVVAGVLTPVIGLTGGNIGPTKYCMNVTIEPYVGAGAIITLVNDTLVFLAISWKLMRNTYTTNALRWDVKVFFRGDYLPAFSRGLLQDGQVYYLTTVTTNLLTVMVFYFHFVPVVYRAMFAVPNAVLMNIMACRVYRRTKSTYYQSSKNSSMNLGATSKMNDDPIPLSFAPKRNARSTSGPGGAIEVHKTVEQHDDRFEDHKSNHSVNGNDNSTIV